MDIKSKLSMLSSPLPVREVAGSASQDRLAALRRKMAELLAAQPPAQLHVEPDWTEPQVSEDWPFELNEAYRGQFWRRQQVLASSTHVGKIPLEAAKDACPRMLSLLSLCPELEACQPGRALFLDTETTGLGGAGCVAFLVGLAWFEDTGRLVLEQLLLRTPEDEPAMLHHLAERIRTAGLIVTYNGKCFDIPLLMSRYVMNRLPEPQAPPHLDLLHVARRLHRARLQHCQLKSLESGVLGFQRGEDIPGAEIPPLYGDYLRTGDCDLLLPVVDHNAWDVMSMAALVGLYGEPEGVLHPEDLVGLATTLKRAGALEQAERIARQALAAGAGPQALMVSGQIAKARGDKDGALADFLALNREIDDARVRLELAKLYEHHLRAPLKALNYVELGTGERPEKAQRRRERLLAKHLKQIEQSRSLRAPAS